jgi:hypothetical protein
VRAHVDGEAPRAVTAQSQRQRREKALKRFAHKTFLDVIETEVWHRLCVVFDAVS